MADISILSHMNIAVVDDHELIREGLNAILANNGIKGAEGGTHLRKYCY